MTLLPCLASGFIAGLLAGAFCAVLGNPVAIGVAQIAGAVQ